MEFLTLGVAIVSELLGAVGNNKRNAQNKKASKAAMSQTNRDVSIRALQERILAALEERSFLQEAREAAGMASSAAAAGNVGGMTVDLLLQDIQNQASEGVGTIRLQRDVNITALEREREAGLTAARNMARQTAPVNPFAVGLRIAGHGLDWRAAANANRPPVSPPAPLKLPKSKP